MEKSVVTQYENISAFSGRKAECMHHLIFGSSHKLCDDDKLLIPLTHAEHNASPNGLIYQIHENPAAEHLSKMLGQAIYEKEYYRRKLEEIIDIDGDPSRDQFRKRYGESFL